MVIQQPLITQLTPNINVREQPPSQHSLHQDEIIEQLSLPLTSSIQPSQLSQQTPFVELMPRFVFYFIALFF